MTTRKSGSEFLFAALVTAAWALLFVVADVREGTAWWVVRAVAAVLIAALAVLWSRRAPADPRPPKASRPLGPELLTLLLLLGLTIVVYGYPMRLRFWIGTDEFQYMLPPTFESHWLKPPGGRPLLAWPVQMFAQHMTGQRIEPFLWLAVLLWFANAVLLRSIVRRLTGSTLLATLAAVLFIVHRAELLRFCVLANAIYYLLPFFFFLSAVALWLHAYDRAARGLLVASCALLATGLLMTEGLFPLAAIVPFLAWAALPDRRRHVLWSACWLGLVGVLAAKFVLYLGRAGADSYQSRQLGDALGDPGALSASLLEKLGTITEYLRIPDPTARYAAVFWAAAVVAGGALLVATRVWRAGPTGRVLCATLLGGLVAAVLGLLPFLHLGMARSQFFVAAGHAVVLAAALLVPATLLPRRLVAVALVVIAGALAGESARQSMKFQSYRLPLGFAKTVHVFEQIRTLAPRFEPGTLVVLRVGPGESSPLSRFNYHVWNLSRAVLGVQMLQAGTDDLNDQDTELSAEGARSPLLHGGFVPIERIVVFDTAGVGTVRLVGAEELPWPGYDPRARIRPGPAAPLPFLRRPAWLPAHEALPP